MQPLKVKQFADLKWNVAVLIVVTSVMILVSTISQAQHENGSGKLVGTAAGTDAPTQVMIDNFVYSPVPLSVKVGSTMMTYPTPSTALRGNSSPQHSTRMISSSLSSLKPANIPSIVGFIRR